MTLKEAVAEADDLVLRFSRSVEGSPTNTLIHLAHIRRAIRRVARAGQESMRERAAHEAERTFTLGGCTPGDIRRLGVEVGDGE